MIRFNRDAIALALAAGLSGNAAAADVSLAGTTWTATGRAGLIASDYEPTPGDALLGSSPAGNANFGYVTTFGGVTGVSPLVMVDTQPGFNQTNGSRVVSSTFSAQAGDRLLTYFNYVSTDGRDYMDYAWARLVSATTNQTAAWLITARSANAPDNDNTSDYIPGKVLKQQVGFDALNSGDIGRQIDAVLNDGNPVIGVASDNTFWEPLGLADSYGWCWDVGTSCGYTGWVKSDYAVTASDTYFLEIGVTNWGDELFQSALAFDFVGLPQRTFGNTALLAAAADVTEVPEPGTWALMLSGLGMLGFMTRRRTRSVA